MNTTVGVISSPVDYGAIIEVIVKSGVKIVETAGRSMTHGTTTLTRAASSVTEAVQRFGVGAVYRSIMLLSCRFGEKCLHPLTAAHGWNRPMPRRRHDMVMATWKAGRDAMRTT